MSAILLTQYETLAAHNCEGTEQLHTQEGKALLRQWGVPEHYRGIGCCILGYADEAPAPKERAANRIWKI